MIGDAPRPGDDELAVVVGVTASGKTALAMRLCERWGGEIVSADSVQIYRAFDIGSGKPSAAELARVRHHLVGEVDPLTHVDAAEFVAHADAAIAEVRARGRVPVVCGGTFLWIKALLFGLAPMPAADPALRATHEARAAAEGRAALHADLARVDPESAARLAPNDLVRVSRALEVYERSGRPLSAWHREHRFAAARHEARLYGVARARADVEVRIRERARRWLAAGWIDETRELLLSGYGGARAMDAVGYRQVRAHLQGELPGEALEDAVVRATRVFARRQRTWLRDQPVALLAPAD